MEKDDNYLLVGGFVLALALAAALFALWLIGPRDNGKYTAYRIRFSESVSGLAVGGGVKFRGVDVGKVESIGIDPADAQRIRVDILVLKTTPVKTDTVASLKLAGVTGSVYIELTGSTRDAPPLARPGDDDNSQIPEIPAEQSSIGAIVNILPEILQKVSVISVQAGKLLSDDNIGALHNVLAESAKVTTALARQTGELDALLHSATQAADDVHGLIRDSKGDIRALAENLNHTSQQLNALIAQTNGAAGGQYQQLYQLMGQLKSTARDIDQLAHSLKENPSQLILPPPEKGIPAP